MLYFISYRSSYYFFSYAHEKEVNRRMEEVCRENQIAFHRMMEEAESTAQVYGCILVHWVDSCNALCCIILYCTISKSVAVRTMLTAQLHFSFFLIVLICFSCLNSHTDEFLLLYCSLFLLFPLPSLFLSLLFSFYRSWCNSRKSARHGTKPPLRNKRNWKRKQD